MTYDNGHGGALAPVTYLPGVRPPQRAASLPPRRRSAVAFTDAAPDEPAEPGGSDELDEPAAFGMAPAFGGTDEPAVFDGSDESAVFDGADESAVFARSDDLDATRAPIAFHATADLDDVPRESEDREAAIASASTSLTRSLGRRGLSISEARAKLRTSGLTAEESIEVIESFVERGWLDDAVLAEQLVHSATTRQGMGTKAIRQLLQKRMLAREVIDEVIAELPDDDVERALEFAASKARSLLRLDDETATRRLMGQLARRGFGGSVAGNAARTALADARREAGGSTGVRFR